MLLYYRITIEALLFTQKVSASSAKKKKKKKKKTGTVCFRIKCYLLVKAIGV